MDSHPFTTVLRVFSYTAQRSRRQELLGVACDGHNDLAKSVSHSEMIESATFSSADKQLFDVIVVVMSQ